MPEPAVQAGASEQTEQTASTPAPAVPDQPTTTKEEQKTAPPPNKGLMDFLDIPAEVQERIAPKAEEPAAEEKPPEPKPPAEKPKKPEQPEEDEDEDEEPEEVKPAAQDEQKPDKRQKRINRLTRRLHSTESQLDDALKNVQALTIKLKEKTEEAEKTVVPGKGPLSHISTEQELDQELAQSEATIEFCDANPEGTTVVQNGEEKFISPETIAQWRRDADRKNRNIEHRRVQIGRAHV